MAQSTRPFASFTELMEHLASVRSGDPALRYERDGATSTLSRGEFAEAVLSRAGELHETGKSCECVFTDNSLESVIELFAVPVAGMQLAVLPQDTSDFAAGKLFMLADVDSLWDASPIRAALLAPDFTSGIAEPTGNLLFFTSGQMNRQRAVALSQSALLASAWSNARVIPLSSADTVLCPINYALNFAFVRGLLWPIASGAVAALSHGKDDPAGDFGRFSPTAAVSSIAQLGKLLDAEAVNPELRLVVSGSGHHDPHIVDRAMAAGIRVALVYGASETASCVSAAEGADPYAQTICPGVQVKLSSSGEILIGQGPNMMKGYYHEPHATAERVQDGWYHSGDMGQFSPDGTLRIVGSLGEVMLFNDGSIVLKPDYEAQLFEALGTHDVCVVMRNEQPVLVCGEYFAGPDVIMTMLAPVMASLPEAQRISRVMALGHKLPRNSLDRIQRWAIEAEVARALEGK